MSNTDSRQTWQIISRDGVDVVRYRRRLPQFHEIIVLETSQRAVTAHVHNISEIVLAHPPHTALFFLLDIRQAELPLRYFIPHMRTEQRRLANHRGKITWSIIVKRRPFITMVESVLQSFVKLDERAYFTDYGEAEAWILAHMSATIPQAD